MSTTAVHRIRCSSEPRCIGTRPNCSIQTFALLLTLFPSARLTADQEKENIDRQWITFARLMPCAGQHFFPCTFLFMSFAVVEVVLATLGSFTDTVFAGPRFLCVFVCAFFARCKRRLFRLRLRSAAKFRNNDRNGHTWTNAPCMKSTWCASGLVSPSKIKPKFPKQTRPVF